MLASRVSESPSKPTAKPGTWLARKNRLRGLALLGILAFVVIGVLLAFRWPFREAAVIQDLVEAGSGKVEIKSFRQTYFPYPGCVVEGMTYRLAADAPSLATLEKLTIQSNLLGLLASHLRMIRVEGMHVYVPPANSKQKFHGLNSTSTRIDEIDIHDAVLEVPRKEAGKPPVEFAIHDLTLDSVIADRAIHFSAKLSNPEPPGEITAVGQFGPWHGIQTPVSGDYTFANADLGRFEGIAGILSSQGKFSGVLQHINVAGKIGIPDFEVARSQHQVTLNSEFDAYVDGANGDTFLNQVSSQFSKTRVISKGKIAGTHGRQGKTATIDLEAQNGRIEDILRMFIKSERPPMAGEVTFQGRAILPPGKERFLKKVEMKGDFGISDSSFTRQSTQKKVNQLSQDAQKEIKEAENKAKGKDKNKDKDQNSDDNAPAVLSDLRGHVVLKGGTATFSDLSFDIPGAHAQMHGTYNLISEKIDLHGRLKMDSELSDTAHGARAVILKVLDPFFKKKRGGSDVPVKIGGEYHNPSFGLDVASASKSALSGKK